MSQSDPPDGRRKGEDRRRRPTRPWDVFFSPGRRVHYRRWEDIAPGAVPFVDRHPAYLGVMITAVLLLTLVDGLLTLVLIDAHCEEANPFLALMIERGAPDFLITKYLLTVFGLSFLLAFRMYPLFGSRLRVEHVIPVLLALYLILLGYQLYLSQARPHDAQVLIPLVAERLVT